MTKSEEAVAKLPFEKDPYFPYQYPEEEIAACEALIGKSFPEDLSWYLKNVGWRKIDYDLRSILVRNREYIYELMFEAAEHETERLQKLPGAQRRRPAAAWTGALLSDRKDRR